MKKLMTILFVVVLVAFTACEQLKESLTVTIPLKEKVIDFKVPRVMPHESSAAYLTASATDEKVLLDSVVVFDLEKEAEIAGYNLDALKDLILTDETTVELKEGFEDVDVTVFSNLKLYVKELNEANLVAKAKPIAGSTNALGIEVVKANLLEYMHEKDGLRIIVTGDQLPEKDVMLRLKAKFKAKIQAFKL